MRMLLNMIATWIIICGFIKLITLCFGLLFYWRIATGVWLIMGLINFMFKR